MNVKGTQMMEHFLNSAEFLLSIASGVATLIAWAFKLSYEQSRHKEEIADLKLKCNDLLVKHEALDSSIIKELARIRESLVRLETTLSFYEGKKKSPKV